MKAVKRSFRPARRTFLRQTQGEDDQATYKQQTKKKMMIKNWDEIHANEYFKESKVRSKTRQGLNPPLLHYLLSISELRSAPAGAIVYFVAGPGFLPGMLFLIIDLTI